MDLDAVTESSKIRQIEDIIDIQKANGNINVRQVAFDLASKKGSTISANLVKSLDSGLCKVKPCTLNKKNKKQRYKTNKNLSSDVVSWPSDSDITVLRMKLYLTRALKKETENVIPGDGLHQPDSSSMINLATLMVHSQSPSKHSLNIEEYLLPINSWEQTLKAVSKNSGEKLRNSNSNKSFKRYEADTSHYDDRQEKFYLSDNNLNIPNNIKSKLARFLRLYFCPCCTCLYKLENIQNEPSTYFTKKVTFVDNRSA
ncbi:uncharacterized protein [Battus philenor]|uniref:uncharacterized protein n=1 Tax=Battus philenor TaxID=42288 RepID=UPI0035D0E088